MAGLKRLPDKKNGQQLREELQRTRPDDYVRFVRSDLPGLAEELELIYNQQALAGKEPSDKYRQLLLWVKQETAILSDPAYSGDFQCDHCGYGNPNFKCPKCGYPL